MLAIIVAKSVLAIVVAKSVLAIVVAKSVLAIIVARTQRMLHKSKIEAYSTLALENWLENPR